MVCEQPDGLTQMQRRLRSTGLVTFDGKPLRQLSDIECTHALMWLREKAGISYVFPMFDQ